MVSQDKESIVAKIQALLARADASSNAPEAEREVAMKKALGLLARHKMTMTDVEDASDPVKRHVFKMRHGPWARVIWAAIARLYFCDVLFFTRRGNSACVIYGKAVDAEIAKNIASWVQEYLWKAGGVVKRKAGGHNAFLTSFLNSAAHTIQSRCREMIEKASQGQLDVGDGKNMLVPMSVYEQAWAAAKDAFPDDTKTIKTKMEIRSAWAAAQGRNEASKLNLGRQIGATKNDVKQLT